MESTKQRRRTAVTAVSVVCGSLLLFLLTCAPADTANPPSAPAVLSVTPATASTIGAGIGTVSPRNDIVTIVFSTSMAPATLSFGGDLGTQTDGGTWSMTTTMNDTLTIQPGQAFHAAAGRYYWNVGGATGGMLTVDAKGTGGAALATLSLGYSVDNDMDTVVDYNDSCPFDPNCQ